MEGMETWQPEKG